MKGAVELIFPHWLTVFVRHPQPHNHRPRAWTSNTRHFIGFLVFLILFTLIPFPPPWGLYSHSSPIANFENDTWELPEVLLPRPMQSSSLFVASAAENWGEGTWWWLNSRYNLCHTKVLNHWKYAGHSNQHPVQTLNSSVKMLSVNRSTDVLMHKGRLNTQLMTFHTSFWNSAVLWGCF